MKKKLYITLWVVAVFASLILFVKIEDTESTNIEKATKLLGKSILSDVQPLSKTEALKKSRQIVDALNKHRSARQSTSSSKKPIIGLKRGYGHQVPNHKQQQAIDDTLTILPDSTILHMDNFQGTLRYLRGDLSVLTKKSKQYQQAKKSCNFENMAFVILDELAGITGIKSSKIAFKATKVSTDKTGLTHISLAQQIEGIPVWGADIKVHLNTDFEPIEISGIYSPIPKNVFWPEQPINKTDAVAYALAELDEKSPPVNTTIEKIAYWNPNTKPHPCYQVSVSPAMDESYFVFVSAVNGKVIRVYDRIISASATGSALDLQGNLQQMNSYFHDEEYYALDISLPMYNASLSTFPDNAYGGLYIGEWNDGTPDYICSINVNQWDADVVSAQNNMRTAYNYFLNTHGRNSFDDNGHAIYSFIHHSTPDTAFWSGSGNFFAFGSGQSQFYNLAGALDVAGHEYTHAVVQYTAGLIYETQSGALNEHFADLFGAMIDRDDWLIGEDIVRYGTALRDMENPANPEVQSQLPVTMYGFLNKPLTDDHGGVHSNCGILNRMVYILSEEAPSIGKSKLETLAYHALDNYLVQYSQFIDYRRAMISAAQDLYGWGSFEEDAVKSAFNAVSIYDDEFTPDPVTYSGYGNEEVVFLFADEATYNSGTDSPYLVGVHIAGQNHLVSNRYAKKSRPAISGNAMEFAFLDTNGDFCLIDETGEQVFDLGAKIQAFAMSKNDRYLALSYPNTPSIELYDNESEEWSTVNLIISNPDGDDTLLGNPDIMTFSPSGDRLVFDATSTLRFSDGNEYNVWGVYSMRIADKRVTPVWQPSQGAMFGNPHFSNLHPDMIVADMVNLNTLEDQVISINMWQQQGFSLTVFNDATASPSFSGLDNNLIYVEKGWMYNNLYSTAFLGSNFASVSSSKTELYEQSDPIAYPLGYADNPAYLAPKAQISTVDNLNFPNTEEGHVYEIEISVVNAGSAMLEMYDMHLVGLNTPEFSFIAPVSLISPGSSLKIKVRFKPSSAGAKTAVLKIFSTAPDQKETTIVLSGTSISSDSDSDGLLDSWEMEHFGNLNSDINDDNDNDGFSNEEEFIAGTHPDNAESCLRIHSLNAIKTDLRIVWQGGTEATQRVLTASELDGGWNPIFTNYPPTSCTNELIMPLGASNGFFKVEVGNF